MSNRFIERVTSTVQAIVTAMTDITQWGGVPVEPAAPKSDGQSNAANVPEVGARLQGFNETTWDRLRESITTVTSSFLGFLDVIPYGKFNEAPPVLVDGQGAPLQLDANGNLRVVGSFTVTPVAVGTQGNASFVGPGSGPSVDAQFAPFTSIWGTTTGPTTLIIELSQDGVTFSSDDTVSVALPSLAFSVHLVIGARHMRLSTADAVTVTATIAAKD